MILSGVTVSASKGKCKKARSNNVKIRPIIEFKGFRWLFKKDVFTMRRYKWEDPHGHSSSPVVLRRIVEILGFRIGIRYLK
jgi:hypothetical protein